MVFTKRLSFTYDNLGKDGLLIFTFDDERIKGHEMYKDFYPVVWKVAKLQAKGRHQFTQTYKQQFAFATAEREHGNVKTTSAVQDVEFKEITTLTGDSVDGFSWSDPEPFPTTVDQFIAKNGTPIKQTVAVCSDPGFAEPLLFVDIPSNAELGVEFKGILRIYSVTNMEEGTIINSEVRSGKLWEHRISDPKLPERWVITVDEDGGNFVIKEYK